MNLLGTALGGHGGNCSICIMDHVGFGFVNTFPTRESHGEPSPVYLPKEKILFTFEGRIDNRGELFRALPYDGALSQKCADGELVLQAFLRWGEKAPERLVGNWTFGAFDQKKSQLLLARDALGPSILNYYDHEHWTAFSTLLNPLLQLEGIPQKIDEDKLACFFVSSTSPVGNETVFQQIKHLQPAHILSIMPGKTTGRRYWHLENTPVQRFKNVQDYAEGLGAVLNQAVKDRMRGTVMGATLSGGLDSGSVTALTARLLKIQNKRLSTFSHVPVFDTTHTTDPLRFGDESSHIMDTVHHLGNIEPHLIDSKHYSPLEAIREKLTFNPVPEHAASNLFWILDLLRTAKRQGVTTLLTGQGGNATISWKGKPWLRPGIAPESLWDLKMRVKYDLILPLIPDFVVRPLMYLKKRDTTWNHTAIHPDFAHRINVSESIENSIDRRVHHVKRLKNPFLMRLAMIQPHDGGGMGLWKEAGHYFGIDVQDPTLDQRVASYALSIPNRYFTGKGTDRYILKKTMGGLLPEKVLWNPRRGRQSADLPQRLIQFSTDMAFALEILKKNQAAREYLNLQLMERLWHDIQSQPLTHYHYVKSVTTLTRGIMVGLWLTRF